MSAVSEKQKSTLDPAVCPHALEAEASHETYEVFWLSLLHLDEQIQRSCMLNKMKQQPRETCLKLKTLLFATKQDCKMFSLWNQTYVFTFQYWNLTLEAERFHKNRQEKKPKNTMTVMNVLNVTTVSICHPSDPPNLIFSVRTFSSSTRTCIRS